MNEKTYEQKLFISKISKVSFFLAVFSYVQFIFALIAHTYVQELAAIAPLIMIMFLLTSIVLSIIDLTRKNRNKTLSIIALILSSLYFLFIIVAIAIVIFMSSTGKM